MQEYVGIALKQSSKIISELKKQNQKLIIENDALKKHLDIQRVSGSLTDILKAQTDFKLANEIKEIQAKEVFNYIVNEYGVKLTYEEWRKTVKAYYR